MPDPALALMLTRQALDALPVNVAILDAEGRIVWTDDAWRQFATDNDIEGQPDTIGVNYLEVSRDTDELGDAAAEGIGAVLAGDRTTFTLEYPCHSPDEQRWFLMWAGSFDEGDDLFATVAHFDVTDRVLAENEVEAAAEQLSQERDQLALLNQVVRHDIRNDVQLIAAFADLVREDIEADAVDDETVERLERISQQSTHVVDLTSAIGDLSGLITGEGEPSLGAVDLAAVVRDEVEKLEQTYGTEGTDLTVTGLAGLPETTDVRADEMLSSVVGNLLANAVVHNDSDRVELAVGIDEADEQVRLTVADDGPGISPEGRRSVFGRGEKGLESPGSGLGLYLVDRLVEAYGGDVWIEDSDLGGATFIVALQRPD